MVKIKGRVFLPALFCLAVNFPRVGEKPVTTIENVIYNSVDEGCDVSVHAQQVSSIRVQLGKIVGSHALGVDG